MRKHRRAAPQTDSPTDSSKMRSDAAALSEQVRQLLAAHPGQSGARLLPDGLDAFAVRVQSARCAQRSLDIQTYIWHDDATGRYIARELMRAADRGVHVRVLLDDMDARPRDVTLEALDKHPRIEVRIFNPFHTRSGVLRTLAEVLRRGDRLNHRMHNKAWIVDETLAIVGGRNIGDEYFASAADVNFIDLDALLLGPVVIDALREFNRYWLSPAAVPIRRLRKYSHIKLLPQRYQRQLEAGARAAEQSTYVKHLNARTACSTILEPGFQWSRNVRVVADDPRKALKDYSPEFALVLDCLVNEIRATQRQLLLISPYFVPGIGGTMELRDLALQGAEVSVLTNSLAATDVAAVHGAYARYRQPLLEAGVRLFEMKHSPRVEEAKRLRLGSTRASLHTKAAVVDEERVFIGSFNIDPRSAQLNCEMGVWIRNRKLARELAQSFRFGTEPERAFELSLDGGKICWTERDSGFLKRHFQEPHANWKRRLLAWFLTLLPIESQL
jgi:putative cardiolipin synthase